MIKRNGDWYHEGQKVHRLGLVRLFASVIRKEGEQHFLVTPVEKVGIQVEDSAFVIVQANKTTDAWLLTDNLGEQRTLCAEHPLRVNEQGAAFVGWQQDCDARVLSSVFYQLQLDALNDEPVDQCVYLTSAGERFYLGTLDTDGH